jgi:hypothetical protein
LTKKKRGKGTTHNSERWIKVTAQRSMARREVRACKVHGMVEHAWHKRPKLAARGHFVCMECSRESVRRSMGCHPMSENRSCAGWLGIHVAERALSKFFAHITRTPSGSSGGDFRCDKGFLIDVKCACLHFRVGQCAHWTVFPGHNTEADFFLFLLFDNRKDLTPMHVMLVPGCVVNNQSSVSITNNIKSLAKWVQYEKPLDKVVCCCEKMRSDITV